MHPYTKFVVDYASLLQQGKSLALGGFPSCPRPQLPAEAPKALIFSPHPDDECIIGGLPLRLLRESKMRVVNVAVTQGSNRQRQAERYDELKRACDFIGYDLIQTKTTGLEGINLKGRDQSPAAWQESVQVISKILQEARPRVIFFPHEHDWNSSHIGTHFLVRDALEKLGPSFECHVVETEYWGQNIRPNLMVESSPDDVADLVAGTSFHVGEVRRNPFHLFLPAWMQDNVRRGSELVGGQGEAAPDFTFATLYRLRKWSKAGFQDVLTKGRSVSLRDTPASLFA